MATQYIIKTSGGTGAPGYTDSNAPTGKQWRPDNPEIQGKVPEGTPVQKTGDINDFVPPYLEVRILSGKYIGQYVWVKSTYLVSVVTPTPEPPPPTPTPEGDWKKVQLRIAGVVMDAEIRDVTLLGFPMVLGDLESTLEHFDYGDEDEDPDDEDEEGDE